VVAPSVPTRNTRTKPLFHGTCLTNHHCTYTRLLTRVEVGVVSRTEPTLMILMVIPFWVASFSTGLFSCHHQQLTKGCLAPVCLGGEASCVCVYGCVDHDYWLTPSATVMGLFHIQSATCVFGWVLLLLLLFWFTSPWYHH
jgi:hypothetical protein